MSTRRKITGLPEYTDKCYKQQKNDRCSFCSIHYVLCSIYELPEIKTYLPYLRTSYFTKHNDPSQYSVCCKDSNSFFFMAQQYFVIYVPVSLSSHMSRDVYVDSLFYELSCSEHGGNSHDYISFDLIPKNKMNWILRWVISQIFGLMVFCISAALLYIASALYSSTFFPNSCEHQLFPFNFWIIDILTGVK